MIVTSKSTSDREVLFLVWKKENHRHKAQFAIGFFGEILNKFVEMHDTGSLNLRKICIVFPFSGKLK